MKALMEIIVVEHFCDKAENPFSTSLLLTEFQLLKRVDKRMCEYRQVVNFHNLEHDFILRWDLRI